MNLTEHFTLEEFVHSGIARVFSIPNDPPEGMIDKMRNTCEGLERIRLLLKKPIIITSGYRSQDLNKAVNGSKFSQHMVGEAADIICPGLTVHQVALVIRDNAALIGFDQLIKENNGSGVEWIHVSFSDRSRNQIFSMTEAGLVSGIV